jgi:tRNA A37 threonylcarbamoyladenosine dehydratase
VFGVPDPAGACGGIGSWTAEFVARAGVKRLVVCDPGKITGGLLVRQNLTENDIGDTKAVAMRRRIAAIRDDIEVAAHVGVVPDDLTASFPAADVVVDATISTEVKNAALCAPIG